MSPASQEKHKKLAQFERTNSIRKLTRYEENEITWNDDQNEEMQTVMKEIGNEELQKVCDEGKKYGYRFRPSKNGISQDHFSNSKLIIWLYTGIKWFMQVMVGEVIDHNKNG